MTLQQTLEKLAAVAGDWLHWRVDSNGICSIYIKEYIQLSGYTVEQTLSKKNLSLLFGAICEKCKAEGWSIRMDCYNGINSSKNVIEIRVPFEAGGYQQHKKYGGKSDTHPAHAAAKALLAALEARAGDCPDCDNGEVSMVNFYSNQICQKPCDSCNGTGKQSNQQEQINE